MGLACKPVRDMIISAVHPGLDAGALLVVHAQSVIGVHSVVGPHPVIGADLVVVDVVDVALLAGEALLVVGPLPCSAHRDSSGARVAAIPITAAT